MLFRSGGLTAFGLSGLLVLGLPAVNAAYLLPRLALTPQTSLGLGYERLSQLSAQLLGRASPPFPGQATAPTWPLDLATFPGISQISIVGLAILHLASLD